LICDELKSIAPSGATELFLTHCAVAVKSA
jgi:hypothetical protein